MANTTLNFLVNRELSTKRAIKNLFPEYMSSVDVEEFVSLLIKDIHSQFNSDENDPKQWMSVVDAVQETGIERHHIRRLVADGDIQKNSKTGQVNRLQTLSIAGILARFGGARKLKLIKENDLSGSRAYYRLKFNEHNSGKGMTKYQIELIIATARDFIMPILHKYFDFTPKKDVIIPKAIIGFMSWFNQDTKR